MAIDMRMNRSVLNKKSFKMLELSFSTKSDWGSCIVSVSLTVYNKIEALICSMKFLSPEVACYLCKSAIWPCM